MEFWCIVPQEVLVRFIALHKISYTTPKEELNISILNVSNNTEEKMNLEEARKKFVENLGDIYSLYGDKIPKEALSELLVERW